MLESHSTTIKVVMMEMKWVLETLDFIIHLTQLSGREDIIEFFHCENFKAYMLCSVNSSQNLYELVTCCVIFGCNRDLLIVRSVLLCFIC